MHLILMILVMMASTCMSAVRKPRLTVASETPGYYYTNVNNNPGTYSFGYDILDPDTGTTQFRSEERYPNGTVVGSYGYIDPRGKSRRFDYIADESGYRIKSEPPKKEALTSVYTIPEPTTESSITWTRPSKPKRDKTNRYKPIRRQFNTYQPPSYYVLY